MRTENRRGERERVLKVRTTQKKTGRGGGEGLRGTEDKAGERVGRRIFGLDLPRRPSRRPVRASPRRPAAPQRQS
eukprot:scaffold988_cov105-Isochrysis_galbana.AAC.1